MSGSENQSKPRSRVSGDNDQTEKLQTNSLYRALSHLLNSDKFSDMTIRCGSREFRAHRAIVCPQSSFFDMAMTSGFSEAASGIVNLPEDDPDVVERFLQFLYTGTYKEDDVPGWGPPSGVQNLTPEEVDAFLATAPGISFLDSDDETDAEGEWGKDKDEQRHEQNGKDNANTLIVGTNPLSPVGRPRTHGEDEAGPATNDGQSDAGSNFSDTFNSRLSMPDEPSPPAEEYAEFAPDEDHVQVLNGTGVEAELPLNRREEELKTGEENELWANTRFIQELRIQQGFFLPLRLYIMADKFDVPSLKLLARDRFYRAAELSWFDHPSFPAAVDEVYTCTAPNDPTLREIVCRLVGCNIHSQEQRSRLDEVMRKHGDFAVGVLNYFINWHHR